MFDGTPHEKDWMFYHDALSQLTNKDTVEWMKKTKDNYSDDDDEDYDEPLPLDGLECYC